MELKLSQTSLPATIIGTSYKQLSLLAQAWKKLQIRRISWKGHKDIVDFDLVYEGQYVNIPSTDIGVSQKCHFDRDKSQHQLSKAAAASGLRFLGGQWGQTINAALPRRLSHVKAKSSVLVLVPLMAVCIGFILGALQNRAARNSRHRRSENNLGRPFSERWRTVLSETKDTDELDVEYQPNSEGGLSEEREGIHYEDHPHAYAKLEGDYQKFLNECGMSKYGYFRGGSPE